MANSRLNSRIVTSKGMQLLQFPKWGDNNKDKFVILRTTTFCKRPKKTKKNPTTTKKTYGKAVLFFTAPHLLSTSSTKCTDHGQYKGIYVFQLPASAPIPCDLPLLIRLVLLVPASPERLWSCSCWSLCIMLSNGLISWFTCWLRTWFNPVK